MSITGELAVLNIHFVFYTSLERTLYQELSDAIKINFDINEYHPYTPFHKKDGLLIINS
jgi:hypothetical protein